MSDLASDGPPETPDPIKALLLRDRAALREYQRIKRGIQTRYALLKMAQNEIRPLVGPERPAIVRQLATVDVFVEKAQDKLTARARRNDRAAKLTIAATLSIANEDVRLS